MARPPEAAASGGFFASACTVSVRCAPSARQRSCTEALYRPLPPRTRHRSESSERLCCSERGPALDGPKRRDDLTSALGHRCAATSSTTPAHHHQWRLEELVHALQEAPRALVANSELSCSRRQRARTIDGFEQTDFPRP